MYFTYQIPQKKTAKSMMHNKINHAYWKKVTHHSHTNS